MNIPRATWRATKHIFQITYNEQLGLQGAELLRSRSYRVVSIIGNEAAKVLSSPIQHYDLFPEGTRQEMAVWLKAKYPRVKILALNPPNQEVLRADYNVPQDAPENLLSIISQELANSTDSPGSTKASMSGA